MFKSSPIFNINRYCSVLKLSHIEIQEAQAKLSEELMQLIVSNKNQNIEEVILSKQKELLASKFQAFKNAYLNIETDEDFENTEKLCKEFKLMDGAEKYLSELDPEETEFLQMLNTNASSTVNYFNKN